MDVFEAIKQRRSSREFLPDEIPPEDINLLLDMARYAPTAGNRQPWRFLIVKKKENKEALKAQILNAIKSRITTQVENAEMQQEQLEAYSTYVENVFSAPIHVLVFVDISEHPELVVYDGALAVQNLMLAATALGYGTCFQTTIFPEEIVRSHFAIPEKFKFICCIPIGKTPSKPDMPEKKPLETFIWEEEINAQ